MRLSIIFSASLIVMAGLASALINPAHAALGGYVRQIPQEAAALKATRLAARPITATYSRHDLALPDGGLVSEFTDVNGQVFAVSWNTPTMPELVTLLGSYSSTLAKAQLPQVGMGRAPRQIDTRNGDCVLFSTGHLRAYQGYTYLFSQLPNGFDLKDLSQ